MASEERKGLSATNEWVDVVVQVVLVACTFRGQETLGGNSRVFTIGPNAWSVCPELELVRERVCDVLACRTDEEEKTAVEIVEASNSAVTAALLAHVRERAPKMNVEPVCVECVIACNI